MDAQGPGQRHPPHIRTRPYRPRTNGKAERFIQTLLGGWAYERIYRDSGCPGPSSPDTWVDSWMMPDRDRSGAIGRAAGAWEAI